MTDSPERQQAQAAPRVTYLHDYQPPTFIVERVELRFDLYEEATQVRSCLQFRRNTEHSDVSAPLRLDGHEMELISVVVDGVPLTPQDYEVTEGELVISQVPESFSLEIETRINPAANSALEGLYLSSDILCTQCEAQGFRRITYFPDRPDVMSRYHVTLVADGQKYPVLLSNGNLVESGVTPDGRHYAVWDDPSLKPSYLFAVVAGQLLYKEDYFTTMSGRRVTLRIYVEPENIHKCDHAMRSLQQAMQWDEETYGREYDLDIYMIVAVNDFNMGAMENKGLNVFNASCVLASPETATDDDYYTIQSIIGHEYFHNWSGNRVTCRDWFQLSLKEGFTVFRDEEFSADLNSRAVKRIDDVNVLRTHQFAQDAGPMAHPVRPDQYIEISNFYTVTVYNKGAEVVRMQRNLVGAEGFRKGTDLYFSRHDGQAVTTDDFVRAMEDVNQIDLAQFKRWYSQAGTPVITMMTEYNPTVGVFTLTLRQICPATPGQTEKLPFHIPIAIGLLDHNGKELPIRFQGEGSGSATKNRVLELTEAEQQFIFEGFTSKPVVSLLRDFSAPVKIVAERTDDELAFLYAHDTNPFNRWDAGQQLALKTLLRLITDYQSGVKLQIEKTFIDAVRKTLLNSKLDLALIAQAITLPSEAYIADQCEVVDPDAIHAAREFVRRVIAMELKQEFMTLYRTLSVLEPYVFNAASMAQRALKNVCLAYLMQGGGDEAYALCLDQYRHANNMTDSMQALIQLAHHTGPARESTLTDFYQRWQSDPQVVDKWFSVQASAPLPDTLLQVRQLMRHPAFSLKNPNKVRAVVGRFAMANPVRFHVSSGEGYQLLADVVIQLDEMNPQIAARMLQSMSRWRRYDLKRQKLMQAQLQRVLMHPDISKDVYEIASKSLAV